VSRHPLQPDLPFLEEGLSPQGPVDESCGNPSGELPACQGLDRGASTANAPAYRKPDCGGPAGEGQASQKPARDVLADEAIAWNEQGGEAPASRDPAASGCQAPAGADPGYEDPAFLRDQLITYIGNKRALLGFIGAAVAEVRRRLGKERLRTADLFSGSGVVARYLKQFSETLIVNDLESYCRLINRCYLANRSELDLRTLRRTYDELRARLQPEHLHDGMISELYAPRDDRNIQPGERAFYTRRNARYLDTARALIAQLPEPVQPFFLAPLLSEASIRANTAGVFKGFYKDRRTGVGTFGGSNGDALSRITGEISLPFPVFSRFECEVAIHQESANALAEKLEPLDLVYLDPPYNQHPYGSNYFMLNLLTSYERPERISRVSGIPADWRRSRYNRRREAFDAFAELVRGIQSRFLLVSFNSEGFIRKDEILKLLRSVGRVEHRETPYNAFRGSRNLRSRDIHVQEYLFLVEKGR